MPTALKRALITPLVGVYGTAKRIQSWAQKVRMKKRARAMENQSENESENESEEELENLFALSTV